MMSMYRVAAALGLVASVAVAQNPPAAGQATPQRPKQPAAGAQGQMGQMGQMGRPNRAQLEQRIGDRIGAVLKKNLNLSDDQFGKLQATNKRFEERRHLLVGQERDARMGMRELMIAGDTANQAKVSAALDRMLQIQRQRFESIEQEQKELAGFLTPMQRAKYLGMQEQMFRRVEALRQQGMNRAQQRGGRPMGGGMGRGMGQGMGPGMGQGKGPGMGGQPPMAGRPRNPQRPLRGQAPPPSAPVPPAGEQIP